MKRNYFPIINPDKYTMQRLLSTTMLDQRAEIALTLIEHWGTVAGKISDKEDSSGRSVLTLQEPEELVQRCFRIAELFIQTCEELGYIKDIPVEQTTSA